MKLIEVNNKHQAVLQVSCYGYDHKPTHSEISTMCWSDVSITVSELVERISSGFTFTPLSRKKNECWDRRSNVLFIDIDHSTISMIEHLGMLQYEPTVAYETFSDSADDHRYRFVYVFDRLYNGRQFESLVEYVAGEINLAQFDRRVVNQYYNGTCSDKDIHFTGNVYELPYLEECTVTEKVEKQDDRYKDLFSEEVWNNYWTMSMSDFKNWYWGETGLELPYETPYVHKGDERILERPDGYLRLPVKYCWDKDLKESVRVQWSDGENRYLKLWNCCMVLMRMQTVTADELLYYVVDYFLNYINNSDGKYGKLDLVQKVVEALKSDISHSLNSGKYPAYRVDRSYCLTNKVTPRQVANKVNAERHTAKKLERYKEIAKWYDPAKTDKENLLTLADKGITISERTLRTFKKFSVGAAKTK